MIVRACLVAFAVVLSGCAARQSEVLKKCQERENARINRAPTELSVGSPRVATIRVPSRWTLQDVDLEALDRGETLESFGLVRKEWDCGTPLHPRIELEIVNDCDPAMSRDECQRKRHPGKTVSTWLAGGTEAAIFWHQVNMTYLFKDGSAKVLEWHRGYLLKTPHAFVECRLVFVGELDKADDKDLAAACEAIRLE